MLVIHYINVYISVVNIDVMNKYSDVVLKLFSRAPISHDLFLTATCALPGWPSAWHRPGVEKESWLGKRVCQVFHTVLINGNKP